MRDTIQYTIRNVPLAIDVTLKAQAAKQGISLNKLVLQKLGVAAQSEPKLKIHHDLDWFFADMTPERMADAEELDHFLKEQRRKDRKQASIRFEADKASGGWD